MTKQDYAKHPVDFLYIFITDNDLATVRKYLGSKAMNIIAAKRENQIALLYKVVFEGNKAAFETANVKETLSNAFVEQYGIKPKVAIAKLLAGETVAGKNWKKGVYGIGKSGTTQHNLQTWFSQDNMQVDYTNGKIYTGIDSKGNKLYTGGEGKPIYANNGDMTEVVGYGYTIGDKVYTTQKTDDGTWWADTYAVGYSDTAQFADGTEYTASEASSVWQNIETTLPIIKQFVNWLLKIFGINTETNYNTFTAQNTYPQQSEYITSYNSGSSISTASVGILGASLLAGWLFFGNKQSKPKSEGVGRRYR